MTCSKLGDIMEKFAPNGWSQDVTSGLLSYKEDGVLYLKPVGCGVNRNKERWVPLATLKNPVGPNGQVDHQKEANFKSPFLHAHLQAVFVLQISSGLISCLVSSVNGESASKELCPDSLWITVNGNEQLLEQELEQIQSYQEKNGACPSVLFFEHQGVVITGSSMEEILQRWDRLRQQLKGKGIESVCDQEVEFDQDLAVSIAPALRMLYQPSGQSVALRLSSLAALNYAQTPQTLVGLSQAFTLQQALWCGETPLWIEGEEQLAEKFSEYREQYGSAPHIVAVKGVGFFILASNYTRANQKRAVWQDAMQVVANASVFGGVTGSGNLVFSKDQNSHSGCGCKQGRGRSGRMQGKICLVTGAAQGFGQGIARGLAAQGAYVVIADMNLAGAQAFAEELNEQYASGTALAVEVNVADENSVENMVKQTVLFYGGLDVLVSNAGIAIAGDLTEMSKDKFEKVTAVNYTGYFLCTKHAVIPMKIQHKYSPEYAMDIIEINSKSGLEGSNKNFAYAGSKFGGIGLTESFALELVGFGIKVNAICPGNLLDGPLWSDPEKGLFRQYFEAGKVPGAKSVADVRRFYESKVPMNRGCTVEDVSCAILYIVEQKYETGQALPVTGGQVMLK